MIDDVSEFVVTDTIEGQVDHFCGLEELLGQVRPFIVGHRWFFLFHEIGVRFFDLCHGNFDFLHSILVLFVIEFGFPSDKGQ